MSSHAPKDRPSLVDPWGEAKRSPTKLKKTRKPPGSPVQAIRSAKPAKCPKAGKFFAWSMETGESFELPCGSWECSVCGWLKKKAALLVILSGIQRAWFEDRQRVRLLTLTDGTEGTGLLTVADFYERWNRFRVRMKRAGYISEFCAVLEVQERGALHLHVLLTGSAWLGQKRWAEAAAAAGFGRITDIREVKRGTANADHRSAFYVAKEMASYVSKQKAEALTEKTNLRKRPLRTSRGWSPMSLKQAEQKAAANETKRPYDPEAIKTAQEARKPWATIRTWGDLLEVRFPEEYGDFTLWERDTGLPDPSELGLLPLAA